MPCRDPRDNMGYKEVEACENRYSGWLEEVRADFDKLTDLLCNVSRAMDNNKDTRYLDENPEFRLWWENHKKADEERLEKERKLENYALAKVESAMEYFEKYEEMSNDSSLLQSDREYFARKLEGLKTEIAEAFKDFPNIARKYA